MNPPSGPRPQKQQQQQKQKQKTLIIKKPENTLDFHSRLIEAPEVRFSIVLGGFGGCRAGRFHFLGRWKAYLSG
jgi:hypothetical protein